jgi:hypothetical protein
VKPRLEADAAVRQSGFTAQGVYGPGKISKHWIEPVDVAAICQRRRARLGAALLGPDRVAEFRQMVPLLEPRGFPKIDQLMGGRYVPAVRAFFDHQYGLDRDTAPPLAPDGTEDFEGWRAKQKRRA